MQKAHLVPLALISFLFPNQGNSRAGWSEDELRGVSLQTRQAVTLRPLDDIAAIVSRYPPGTQFHLESGTYRTQEIKPKSGDRFEGSGPSTILSGAIVLGSFSRLGSLFAARYYAKKKENVHGECEATSPLCNHSQDCFLDDQPLLRVGKYEQLSTGKWLMDEVAGTVVLADNPEGHRVELSTAESAFSGPASGVVITDLSVEKYAVPAQSGAIGDQNPGPDWLVKRCTMRWNHGAGMMLSSGSTVRESRIVSNGQLGLSGHGINITATHNEIALNNFAGFSSGWEAGGAKFSRTTNLKIVANVVHDNLGAGLWTDTDNRQSLYEANIVYNNQGTGIAHEVSFSARIARNIVWGNGHDAKTWIWGAQILIQNSSDVDVDHNTVFVPVGYGNGVGVVLQDRGEYDSANNEIHDNQVTYLAEEGGASGMACDFTRKMDLLSTNHFDQNHYHVRKLDSHHWFWLKNVTWQQFRIEGNETHGTIDTNVTQPPTPPIWHQL